MANYFETEAAQEAINLLLDDQTRQRAIMGESIATIASQQIEQGETITRNAATQGEAIAVLAKEQVEQGERLTTLEGAP